MEENSGSLGPFLGLFEQNTWSFAFKSRKWVKKMKLIIGQKNNSKKLTKKICENWQTTTKKHCKRVSLKSNGNFGQNLWRSKVLCSPVSQPREAHQSSHPKDAKPPTSDVEVHFAKDNVPTWDLPK